ncbi:MAG: response regulator [Thermodesulfobacteriota bacterium]
MNQTDKSNKKVLIVDDSPWVRKMLKGLLDNWGHQVIEAQDGEQALEKLQIEAFDLLICDVVMPNKTGWEVLNEVKRNPKTQDIPVIMLTSMDKDADMIQGYALGATYYMTKPFTKAQLLYGLQLMFEET